MAEIAHAYAEQLTEQTLTGTTTFTDISGAEITSGNFVTGDKYLIIAHLLKKFPHGGEAGFRVIHGSTEFTSSLADFAAASNNATWYPYLWFTVWTAVSGEGIKIQFHPDATDETVYARRITLFAMNLSNDVTENTDWFSDENSILTALSTAWSTSNNASVTFTPAAGDDWAVMTRSRIDANGSFSDNQMESRIDRSGEATSIQPEGSEERESSVEFKLFGVIRTFNLGASSNTFREQSREDANDAFERTHSGIFILNLDKFDVQSNAYTEAAVSLSSTDYATEIQTVSITPNVTGDVLIMAPFVGDMGGFGRRVKSRIQIDGTTHPVTDDVEQMQAYDNADELLNSHSFVESLTSAAHTIDLDASEIGGQVVAEDRMLLAFTMELPAVGGQPIRRRWGGSIARIGAQGFGRGW